MGKHIKFKTVNIGWMLEELMVEKQTWVPVQFVNGLKREAKSAFEDQLSVHGDTHRLRKWKRAGGH